LLIHSADRHIVDFADRVFHLEIMTGGMNRLLSRSIRRATDRDTAEPPSAVQPKIVPT